MSTVVVWGWWLVIAGRVRTPKGTSESPELNTMPAFGHPAIITADWRSGLPVLSGRRVVLREPCASDAPALLNSLATAEVSRYMPRPPSTVEGFEGFIAWALRQRAAGLHTCFAITLKEFDRAIGVFQVRSLEPGFRAAEWGFAIGAPFWGTGVFHEGAELMLAFAFATIGVHRLEARVAVRNGRGNGALLKLGAVQEGLLRRSLLCDGRYLDQALYAIVNDDWRAARDSHARAGRLDRRRFSLYRPGRRRRFAIPPA